MIVAVHAENDAITSGLAAEAKRDGRTSAIDYLGSRPVVAEQEAIQRVAAFAEATECKLHIVHVSSVEGAAVVASDRHFADLSDETCPHYWMLQEDDVQRLGAAVKCAPPLRPAHNGDDLRRMLATGEIDFVASDHSPAPASMKNGDDFFKIWGGIAGVQSTLPAVLTITPPLAKERVAALTSGNTARRFGIDIKGGIAVGLDGDFALVDMWQKYELTRDMLLDRHKLSPYVGRTFRGLVKRTIVRGHTVFRDGKSVGDFRGRLVTPRRAERA